jgi:AraC-like DNA-binding protein
VLEAHADDILARLPKRALCEPSLSICEVAYLVGYAKPAPFHRAFKRWYGVSPDVYRQTQVSRR